MWLFTFKITSWSDRGFDLLPVWLNLPVGNGDADPPLVGDVPCFR